MSPSSSPRPPARPEIAGPIRGDLTLGGTLGAPRVSGNVELASLTVTETNAACPQPKRRSLTSAP